MEEIKTNAKPSGERLPAADTGNASNPLGQPANEEVKNNSLLGEKAETYLRESGNIEDMPDENDREDMEKAYRES